ncbi:MAG: metallophosphoesterase [Candidatus Hydrogenedentes bacterium]|nr:metallophosphoesterase [Candidatus Hydrogenedentota bacterium]
MRRIVLLSFTLLLLIASSTLAHEAGGPPERFSHEVTTAPKPWTSDMPRQGARDFHFVVVSDNSGRPRPGIYREAMEKAELLQPAFVMSVGDMIDGVDAEREGASALLKKQWDEFMTYLEPLKAPFVFVPGNHDMREGLQEEDWARRFGPGYYSFLYQDMLFLVLDSNNYDDAQFAWLEETLKKHADVRWTYLFQHHPFWISNRPTWGPVAKLLEGREKLTVFGGHIHNYAYTSHGNIQYVTLATTGGSSQLRGRRYGEMDHLMMVTATDAGPVMAGIELEGIFPADYLTVDMMEAIRPFENEEIVTAPTMALSGETFTEASWEVTIKNPWDKPMRFKALVEADEALRVSPSAVAAVIPPKGSLVRTVEISADTPVSAAEFQALYLHWSANYDQDNAAPIAFSDIVRLRGDAPHTSQRRDDIAVDGNIAEWGALPFNMARPGELRDNELAWRGPEDGSFRFAVAHDETMVYVAMDVKDDSLEDANEAHLRDFGRAMFRAMGSDPASAKLPIEAVLSVVDGPGLTAEDRTGFEKSRKVPKSSAEVGGKFAHRVSEGRMTMEFAMPRAALEAASGTTTDYVQINVAYNDYEGADARFGLSYLYWHPLWNGESDSAILGVFKLD